MLFLLKRSPFPVRVAFAMMINKSKGQSFDKVNLFITGKDTILMHGQIYVAFLRCKSRASICKETNIEYCVRGSTTIANAATLYKKLFTAAALHKDIFF